jgi:hypothetical protein
MRKRASNIAPAQAVKRVSRSNGGKQIMTQPPPFTTLTPPKKHKIIFLIEPQIPGEEDACLHLVRIPHSGYVVCCNAPAQEDCIACGRPTCQAHFSERTLYVQDREGIGDFLLCQHCATHTREDLDALRQLRLSMNR